MNVLVDGCTCMCVGWWVYVCVSGLLGVRVCVVWSLCVWVYWCTCLCGVVGVESVYGLVLVRVCSLNTGDM